MFAGLEAFAKNLKWCFEIRIICYMIDVQFVCFFNNVFM